MKIQNDLRTEKNDPLAAVYRDSNVKDALSNIGIDLGNHCHPDFILAMANNLKEVKPNTIAIERIDGCQVRNKHLLENPEVLRLVKMYKYSEMAVTNLSCTDGRIFTRFLDKNREAPKKMIDKAGWEKVVLGCSFLHYKRHDLAESMAKSTYKKINDIFFAGSTTSYARKGTSLSGELVSNHRKGAVRAVKGLPRAYNTVVASEKIYRAREYTRNIAEAKITVSPWGWGESCYRDYEALMLGTDVIKPISYQILSNPDIYTDTVFYCRPDWSNLQEVVDKCLDTWEERAEQRKEISKRIIECRQPEAIAGIIEKIIKDI